MEEDTVFISDRWKELMETVLHVLSNAHHSYCLCYFAQNLYGEMRDNLVRNSREL